MWVILLEALGALALLVFIVWWTMFSGRRRGEPPEEPDETGDGAAADLPDRDPDSDSDRDRDRKPPR